MDLIDRQALLKQIDIDSDGEPGYYGDTWKFIDTIKSMPPATQLSTNLAEVGTDCISRQQAIDALGELATFTEDWSCHTWMYTDDVYNAIKQLPPIQSDNGLQKLADEIASFKRCVKSDNSDYLTGYLSALSVVEGMVADMREVTT